METVFSKLLSIQGHDYNSDNNIGWRQILVSKHVISAGCRETNTINKHEIPSLWTDVTWAGQELFLNRSFVCLWCQLCSANIEPRGNEAR